MKRAYAAAGIAFLVLLAAALILARVRHDARSFRGLMLCYLMLGALAVSRRGMSYVSVCTGIAGCRVAWSGLGFRPLSFAEVDSFCSALLAHRHPDVPNVGDFTRFDYSQHEAPDVLIAGTPCQSFSQMGKRAGLADPRGDLALQFLRLAGELRPRWLVWENVTGVLSADQGQAFSVFLSRLARLRYGFAYRVLDAQYFGVPQRRRRVFVVGHYGNWRCAAAVLFERASCAGDPPPRRPEPEKAERRSAIGAACSGVSETLVAQGDSRRGFRNAGGLVMAFYPLHASTTSGKPSPVNHTLMARSASGNTAPHIFYGKSVRRLTPRECERLQGFPDDYTLIPYRGKPAHLCSNPECVKKHREARA